MSDAEFTPDRTGAANGNGETPLAILKRIQTIALVGASAKPERAAHGVMRFLLAQGFRVIPVNPGLAGQALLGEKVFRDLSSVPEPVDMIDIFRNAEAIPGIVDEALALSPKPRVIWMQLGIRHQAAAAKARAAGLQVVEDRCPKIELMRGPSGEQA